MASVLLRAASPWLQPSPAAEPGRHPVTVRCPPGPFRFPRTFGFLLRMLVGFRGPSGAWQIGGGAGSRDVKLRVEGCGWRKFSCITKASNEHFGLIRQLLNVEPVLDETDGELGPFRELKVRFMDFKRRNHVENLTNYQNLAEQQAPKFMVIACADSRVCPSNILGFQPGEAFTVRNIANLVPPCQHGPSETSAALEFAVNSLQVENVLVVGHSRCGGIEALMSMEDDTDSRRRSFIRDWVSIAKSAMLSAKAAAGNLSFEIQCSHCEKESINRSLLNLLTYPWIEKRVKEGTLNLHGGYYNFVDCTFEKWTLVYRDSLFWLLLLIIAVAAMIPHFVIKTFIEYFMPSDIQIAREMEKFGKVNQVNCSEIQMRAFS